MAHLTAPTALHPSTTGPIQSQPLFITQIVFGGKLYRVEARLDDGAGAPLPFTAQYSQAAMQQIQNYAQDLFTAHQLQLNSLIQQPLDIIGANSQGLIKQDATTISHDFLIEPLDREMAARIVPDAPPITPSALKAQDIWNRLSSSILAPQIAGPLPSTSAPVLETTPPIFPPTNLTPQTDPLLPGATDPLATQVNTPFINPLVSTTPSDDPFFSGFRLPSTSRLVPTTDPLTHVVTTPPSTLQPDPLLTPPIDSTGTHSTDPIRTPPLNDTTVLTDPSTPTNLQLDPTHIEQQVTPSARPPRRTILSTELQLRDHDFTAENWYETIPVRTRLRICHNILKAHGIQPVERRVWDRFQEIHQQQTSRDRRAPTIAQLIQEEARRLQEQCRREPSTLTRRQRNQGEHFLRRITQHATEDELNQWFRRYRVNDQFYRFFEEQIEAEGLAIAESERPAWVRAHYTEDIPRFARVLERYLDSN